MTRPNTTASGRRHEALALRLLEEQGYVLHRTVRATYRGQLGWRSVSNDVFGCIDLVAKRVGERTRWIQVTAGSNIGEKKTKLATVPWDRGHDSVEIWRWIGGRRDRVDKRNGALRAAQYFQIYRLDDGFQLMRDASHQLHVLDSASLA